MPTTVPPFSFLKEYSVIPVRMQEAMTRYVQDGITPGSFLCAVIDNDLRGAIFQADDTHTLLVPLFVNWFYSEAPANCCGSRAARLEWVKSHQDKESKTT